MGHPNPEVAVREFLRRAAREPGLLAAPEQQLEQAADVTLKVHTRRDITIIINQQQVQQGGAVAGQRQAAGAAPKKPKRRKLFSGLGKLLSGCGLLAGNAILIPTVP